jgi:hypothetical protein
MTTTFQKRQKEMKRLDKAKAKQERRAQRKLEKKDSPAGDNIDWNHVSDPDAEPLQRPRHEGDPQGA